MDIVLPAFALIVGGVLGYAFRANVGAELIALHGKVDALVAAVKAKL